MQTYQVNFALKCLFFILILNKDNNFSDDDGVVLIESLEVIIFFISEINLEK